MVHIMCAPLPLRRTTLAAVIPIPVPRRRTHLGPVGPVIVGRDQNASRLQIGHDFGCDPQPVGHRLERSGGEGARAAPPSPPPNTTGRPAPTSWMTIVSSVLALKDMPSAG